MKHFVLRAIGKLGSGWARMAAQEYLERLSPFFSVEMIELPEGHEGSAKPDLARTRAAEADSLLKNLPANAYLIALDETGKQLSSIQFSEVLQTTQGRPVCFLVGGSWGLDPSVRERADLVFSFGKITLPHALARVVLLEQLYRSAMIQSGKTYHK